MVVVVVVVVVGEGEAAAAVTSLVAISGLPLPSCFASHGEVREEETAATASVLRAPPPRLGGSMLEAPRGCGGDTSSSRPEHARPLMSVMLAHAYMFMAVSVSILPMPAWHQAHCFVCTPAGCRQGGLPIRPKLAAPLPTGLQAATCQKEGPEAAPRALPAHPGAVYVIPSAATARPWISR